MSATRLTKSGQPVLGTTVELQMVDDDSWQPVKIVGKGMGAGRLANTMVMAIIEWPDGQRERTPYWPDVIWRPVDAAREEKP